MSGSSDLGSPSSAASPYKFEARKVFARSRVRVGGRFVSKAEAERLKSEHGAGAPAAAATSAAATSVLPQASSAAGHGKQPKQAVVSIPGVPAPGRNASRARGSGSGGSGGSGAGNKKGKGKSKSRQTKATGADEAWTPA
jgi:hypothetical protein